ncbi:hypothetical protein JW848_05640 [Candidatus Bipolaricaulota bacterium]|nr:hypothetical protein [Candidatus Bipolaricaulota bacterium]
MTQDLAYVRVWELERHAGYFAVAGEPLAPGDTCVVRHGGLKLATVVGVLSAGEELGHLLEKVIRRADPDDEEAYRRNCADAEDVLSQTRRLIAGHELPMHLVGAEYTLDRALLRVFFTAPHRVDFRGLLRAMSSTFDARIELRQMGARDEARIKGGIGRCGRILCCETFLQGPNPVPMEMAYDQELFVAPERITGVCGRLMCCLAYEHEAYREALATMPKLGAIVSYDGKRAKVISHNVLRRTVTLLTDGKQRLEVGAGDVSILTPGEGRRSLRQP